MKIAYDLDGVLVPDFDQIPTIGGLDEFYAMTSYVRPIFNPQGDYSIITGRQARFRPVTWAWCEKYLKPKPARLFHECTDETPGEYKVKILNSNPDITIYVESDLKIVEYVQQHITTNCKVIHYSTYLEKLL